MLNQHYEAKLQSQLSEWSDRLESLRQQTANTDPDQRAAMYEEIDQLEEKTKELRRELEEYRQVSEIDTDEGVLTGAVSDEPLDGPFV